MRLEEINDYLKVNLVPVSGDIINSTEEQSFEFFICRYLVTQKLYMSIIDKNPSRFSFNLQNPVECISWYDAIMFCNQLSEKLGFYPYYEINENMNDKNNYNKKDDLKWTIQINKNSDGFRLPYSKEWYTALYGGLNFKNSYKPINKTIYTSSMLEETWCEDNSHNETKPIGLKIANILGLYDMLGNVFEWCYDWYESINKQMIVGKYKSGNYRIMCGGCWDIGIENIHTSFRRISPAARRPYVGIRLVKNNLNGM